MLQCYNNPRCAYDYNRKDITERPLHQLYNFKNPLIHKRYNNVNMNKPP